MFFQTDPKISPMAEWGCYFCSILAMDEEASGTTYTAQDVLKLWSQNCQEGDIDYEATILNPNGFLRDLRGGMTFLGRYPPGYRPSSDERQILLYHNAKTGMNHFVLGDGNGNCKWDPYPNSRTVREGSVVSQRIYRVKS